MSDQKRKLEAIFHAAREMSDPEQREIYVQDACRGDAGLRAKVEGLLRASSEAEAIFASGNTAPGTEGVDTFPETPLSEGPGTVIGRYKLLQKIGEGGFGVVYMAEQREPVVRKVALKVIKLGMDTKQVIARFEAERQALALMDHPNIAKVLDGGATSRGRPYFVMELVNGIPITRFCDENKLTTARRLGLFQKVCSAIQHAHQKGIIHRDIKPSNVLVTLDGDIPVPRVIDFGIAKATQQRLTEKTLFTQFQQFIGTPTYMSPEQASLSALDIDTRSDIYSLGVLLYELLTGKTPFDSQSLLSAGYEEIRRVIREVDPPRPSIRLSTLSGQELSTTAVQRSEDPRRLGLLVRGDLDLIAMKALDKDRTRRYETASELAMDLQRFLAHEPVTAVAPHLGYKLRKFVQRNRIAMAVTTTIALLLAGGIVSSTWLAVRAGQAERKAAAQAQSSQQIANVLKSLLERVWSVSTEGVVLLESVSGPTLAGLEGQPEAEMEVGRILGRQMYAFALAHSGALEQKRLTQRAADIYLRVLELARLSLGLEDQELAMIMIEAGDVLQHVGRLSEAESLLRGALSVQLNAPRPSNDKLAVTQSLLALTLQRSGQPAAAAEMFQRAMAAVRQSQIATKGRESAESTVAELNQMWSREDLEAIEDFLVYRDDPLFQDAQIVSEMRELRKAGSEAVEAALAAEQKKLEVGKTTSYAVLQLQLSLLEAKAYESGETKDLLEFLEMQKQVAERALAETRKRVEVGVAAPLQAKMAEAHVAKATFELMKLNRLLRAGNLPED